MKSALQQFKRITTSGAYIAEIDGLRFIAIATVICVHIVGIWTLNVGRGYESMSGLDQLLYDMTMLGGYGVELFFMISGFVLAMPFCNHAFRGGKPVKFGKYLWRRVTRLEPPYVVSMLFFFIMMPLWGKGGYAELLPNLVASLAYLHNIVYNAGSVLNNNAWSLEVEIQFYLLVPLLLKALFWTPFTRRAGLVVGVVFFALHSLWLPEDFPVSVLHFFQYFAMGILFCELWTLHWQAASKGCWQDLPGLLSWPAFFYVNLAHAGWLADLLNPLMIAALFYSALRGRWHGSVLSWRFIPIVGGMCYSIYLVHARVVSLVLHYGFGGMALSGHFSIDFLILLSVTFPVVVICSGIFFLLIEKPCMNPNWPTLLGEWLRKRLGSGKSCA
jgi:peptidoglycan/LPS O-acetylase OafA/YrhL